MNKFKADSPKTPSIDESQLVERLKKGQEWACQVLVNQYQDRLLKIAYGITLDQEESREIVQEVFINALSHIHQFRQKSSLGAWLRKITLNGCLNWKRKWKRRFKWHHTSLDQDNDPLALEAGTDNATPESILREKEFETHLVKAIHRLPEKIRLVFVLNALEGLSYAEIAQTLNISKGTVSSRLFHGRKQILEALDLGIR